MNFHMHMILLGFTNAHMLATQTHTPHNDLTLSYPV